MSPVTLEILVLIFLAVVNGVFAMSEVALLAARRARLEHAAASGIRGAQVALRLLAEPNNFLSTVQIGVTLVGVFSGAFGGITIAEQIAASLQRWPAIAPYGERIGLGVVVLGITYLSLVIGELVPKRIALNGPERIASLVAKPMAWLSRWSRPVLYILSLSTDTLLRLLRVRPAQEPSVTEEEVRFLLRQGTQIGIFEPTEQQIVERVFRLADRDISAIMTLRREIAWLDMQDPWEVNWREIEQSAHSRFPVCDGALDRVLGVVHVKDILSSVAQHEQPDLRSLLKRPQFVTEQMSSLRVLEQFKEAQIHLALVLDEHGSVRGLATPTDMLEAISGELSFPADKPIVRREDGSWLLDGRLPLEDVKDTLKLDTFPDEENPAYRTLAGFVIDKLNKIPAVSEHFMWRGMRFEVVDMDGNRVDRILVIPAKQETPEELLD